MLVTSGGDNYLQVLTPERFQQDAVGSGSDHDNGDRKGNNGNDCLILTAKIKKARQRDVCPRF